MLTSCMGRRTRPAKIPTCSARSTSARSIRFRTRRSCRSPRKHCGVCTPVGCRGEIAEPCGHTCEPNYERTLLTLAPFDEDLRGDTRAISEIENGLRCFIGRGCASCHNGMGVDPADLYVFKVPSLWNGEMTRFRTPRLRRASRSWVP